MKLVRSNKTIGISKTYGLLAGLKLFGRDLENDYRHSNDAPHRVTEMCAFLLSGINFSLYLYGDTSIEWRVEK